MVYQEWVRRGRTGRVLPVCFAFVGAIELGIRLICAIFVSLIHDYEAYQRNLDELQTLELGA